MWSATACAVRRTSWPRPRCGRRCSTRSAAAGPLVGRLLAALDAAEAEGGDVRGRQIGRAAHRSRRRRGVRRRDQHLDGASRIIPSRSLSSSASRAARATRTSSPDRADALVNESRHDEAARLSGRPGRRTRSPCSPDGRCCYPGCLPTSPPGRPPSSTGSSTRCRPDAPAFRRGQRRERSTSR